MSNTPKILALAGSTRDDSLHKKLAQFATAIARVHGTEVRWIDLRDYELPLYNGDLEAEHGQPAAALELRALFKAYDALIIASPEYNGFFSPLLKNTLDWLSRPLPGEERHATFVNKPVLLLSTSRGESGGARGLQTLRQLLVNLKARPHATHFLLPHGVQAFDADHQLRGEDAARLSQLVHNFVFELQHPAVVQHVAATTAA